MNTIVYGSNVVDSIGTLVASGTWSFNGASITSGTVFTAPIAGLYRITGSVCTTTAGSAGTVSVTVDGETSGTADLTALNSTKSVSSMAYLAAAGTFSLATTVASNTGAQYRVDYVVERIGQ